MPSARSMPRAGTMPSLQTTIASAVVPNSNSNSTSTSIGTMLTTLSCQQQELKEQLSEMFSMMKGASERQEAIKDELFVKISENSANIMSRAHNSSIGTGTGMQKSRTLEAEAAERSLKSTAFCDVDSSVALQGRNNHEAPAKKSSGLGDGRNDYEAPAKKSSGLGRLMRALSPRTDAEQRLPEVGWGRWLRLETWQLLLQSNQFEVFIASLILANCFVFIFDVQYAGLQVGYDLQYSGYTHEAKAIWPGAQTVFPILDWSFGVAFVVEAVVKILCFGWKYFWVASAVGLEWSVLGFWKYFAVGMGSLWNWLDFACAGAFCIAKAGSAVIPVSPQIGRLLRLIRLMRLVRLFRTLKALDVLYVMVTSIKGMQKVLFWAIALLSIMLMFCALLLTQVLHATYFTDGSADTLDPRALERHQKMFEYFGTFLRCVLSMFEMTLGNWPPVCRLLSEEVSEWFMLFCVIHKLTIGFAVIGVINGVILQETFRVAATDDVIMVRQKKATGEIAQVKMNILFDALDSSRDGIVTYEEFQTIAADVQVKTWLASMDIETDDLQTLFSLIDHDESGGVEIHELCSRIPRIKGAARSIDVLAMRRRLEEHTTVLNVHSHALKRMCACPVPMLEPNVVTIGGSPLEDPEGEFLGVEFLGIAL